MIRRLQRLGGFRLVALFAILALTSCSGDELAETQALLDECRTDKVAAQGATNSCEDRYQSEVRTVGEHGGRGLRGAAADAR